ncbi:hypothetical protein [Mangrovibacterium sp.]
MKKQLFLVKILEFTQGAHSSLFKQQGYYFNMWQKQIPKNNMTFEVF